MRKALFLATMVLCTIAIFATFAHATQKGSKASNFTLMDLDGNEVSLKQFEGKPVVLNFWATWCPPCRNEMPEFSELDKQFKKTNEAVLLMVNMTDGRRDTKENVEKFMKRNNFDMKVLLDTEGDAAQLYNIRYLPTTYIINSKGVVSGTLTGGTDKANVLKMLKGIK